MNKTVTLDEKKTIDVAKIIKNESRLKSLNDSLIQIINQQNQKIRSLAENNLRNLEKLDLLNAALNNLSKNYDRLSGLQLEYEKDKKKIPPIFAKLKMEYLSADGQVIPAIGLTYINKQFGVGGSLGIFESQPTYGVEIMLSFF